MIFISHSQEDSALYSSLCLALDSAAISRWDSSTMTPTGSLADQLRSAISASRACVFVATRRSILSHWCMAEVGAFWGAAKKIFLFRGEPDLGDADLPPLFRGALWTSDARAIVDALRKEPDISAELLFDRPANIFWLGHDLTRAIRLAMWEPSSRDEFDKNVRQALHHLDAIGLQVPHARNLLLAVLRLHRRTDPVSEEQRKQVINAIAKAKNEIGSSIESVQPAFRGYPTIPQSNQLDREVEKAEELSSGGPGVPNP